MYKNNYRFGFIDISNIIVWSFVYFFCVSIGMKSGRPDATFMSGDDSEGGGGRCLKQGESGSERQCFIHGRAFFPRRSRMQNVSVASSGHFRIFECFNYIYSPATLHPRPIRWRTSTSWKYAETTWSALSCFLREIQFTFKRMFLSEDFSAVSV